MRRTPLRTALAALFVLTLGSPGRAEVVISSHHGRSARGAVDGTPLLILRGDHAERGRAQGALAAREIIEAVDHVAALVAGSGSNWAAVRSQASAFALPTRYASELQGVIDGIALSRPNASDRVVPTLGRALDADDLKALMAVPDLRCSQFSAWGSLTADGQVIVGRNLDYAPLVPPSSMGLVAVEADEAGLARTIDVVPLGMVGGGSLGLNEHGVYLGINNGGLSPEIPTGAIPATLIFRSALESASATDAVDDVSQVLQNAVSGFPRIVHLAFPLGAAPTALPSALEWDPRSTGSGLAVRGPADQAEHLVLTNHFVLQGSGGSDSGGRYDALIAGIAQHVAAQTEIGEPEARALLDLVDRGSTSLTTIISGVVWPAQRRMRVAISPGAGTSALSGNWVTVEWQAIFGSTPAGDSTPADAGAAADTGSEAITDARPNDAATNDAGAPAAGGSEGPTAHKELGGSCNTADSRAVGWPIALLLLGLIHLCRAGSPPRPDRRSGQ